MVAARNQSRHCGLTGPYHCMRVGKLKSARQKMSFPVASFGRHCYALSHRPEFAQLDLPIVVFFAKAHACAMTSNQSDMLWQDERLASSCQAECEDAVRNAIKPQVIVMHMQEHAEQWALVRNSIRMTLNWCDSFHWTGTNKILMKHCYRSI